MCPKLFMGETIRCPYCGEQMKMIAEYKAEYKTESKIHLKLECVDQEKCAYGCNLGYVQELIIE